MVDTTNPKASSEPPKPETAKAGEPEELLIEVEKTLMRFRLEDFDRQELRECSLALFEVFHSFQH
jgi:hypothetical protein